MPSILRQGDLAAVRFELMKHIPAHFVLAKARREGRLPGTGGTVAETSSGTMALGLARECAWKGHHCIIVSDPVIDPVMRSRIETLGAQVVIVRAGPGEGHQTARMRELRRILRDRPEAFWPRQYDNPDCRAAYLPVAELLAQELARLDVLVAPVGSGASGCGIAQALRSLWPELRLVGVDTPGSVLFGCPDGPRMLRGLGNSLLPGNLVHACFDQVHWVPAPLAYSATRRMYRDLGADVGPTSGAACLVARAVAAADPGALVAYLCPDTGERYRTVVLDPGRLQDLGLWVDPIPDRPVRVDHPDQVGTAWAWLPWGRRTLAEVLRGPGSRAVS